MKSLRWEELMEKVNLMHDGERPSTWGRIKYVMKMKIMTWENDGTQEIDRIEADEINHSFSCSTKNVEPI